MDGKEKQAMSTHEEMQEKMKRDIDKAEIAVDLATEKLNEAKRNYCNKFAPFKRGDRVIVDGKYNAIVNNLHYAPTAWDRVGEFTYKLVLVDKDWRSETRPRLKHVYKDTVIQLATPKTDGKEK
jgi:disulfide oxidoreductase YuzD